MVLLMTLRPLPVSVEINRSILLLVTLWENIFSQYLLFKAFESPQARNSEPFHPELTTAANSLRAAVQYWQGFLSVMGHLSRKRRSLYFSVTFC